ncbi:DUF4252 domain-containing protein [Aureisphaera galaxeae]|uniref:DUF4252 domain-containing protein n=1 Tax=Aureisphaera galaxeae TaxID=1538023 RepID=UPI002350B9AA|nr:DUF4252 domain-containing protein [Aureisphaera galaxeae]MDC8003697.1 DUF4252 domain-containing protein [Aureisphaera galaxeae]
MQLVKILTALTIALLTMASCTNDKSLQRYLVDKQEDDRYLKVDLATSLLQSDEATFTEEQQEILNTIKKVNMVAYPLKSGNEAEYNAEKSKVREIIDQEKYKTLSKMKSKDTHITLKYLGEEDAIDEVIVFASNEEKGFGVFRLLCDDMKPAQVLQLMNSIDSGDIDVSKLSGFSEVFDAM